MFNESGWWVIKFPRQHWDMWAWLAWGCSDCRGTQPKGPRKDGKAFLLNSCSLELEGVLES